MKARPHILLLRGLFLESGFHPAGKQRVGFFWALREPWPGRDAPVVNANPTLAGYALGWADRAGARVVPGFHASLFPVLGALGDRIVYAMLRPIAVLAGLLGGAFLGNAAALVLLLVYNPAELYLRLRSIRAGQAGDAAVASDLSRGGLPRSGRVLVRVLALLAGLAAGIWGMGEVLDGRGLGLLVAAACVLPLHAVLRRRTGSVWLLLALGTGVGLAVLVTHWLSATGPTGGDKP